MHFLFAFVMLINFFLGIWYFLCWINLLSLPLLRGTLFAGGWKLVCTRTKQLIYSSLIPALGYINIILSYIAQLTFMYVQYNTLCFLSLMLISW
jgi:hypothetical protein